MRSAAVFFALVAAAAPPAIAPQNIISHLEQVVAWYRNISTVSPPTVDVIVADDLHATSLKVVQLAFSFARAEAATLGGGNNSQNAGAAGNNLQQAAARTADQVADVQSQIAQIESELPKSSGKQRELLQAQRNALNAQLALDKEIQTVIQNLVNFTGAIGSEAGALANQIDQLERSIPEVQGKAPAASGKTTSQTNTFSPESAGVVSLASELLNNHGNRAHLSDLLKSTQGLSANIDKLAEPLIAQTRAAWQRSGQITSQINTQDPAQLAAAQKELSDLAAQFKQLSTAIVPLREEGIAVNTAESYLQESIGQIDSESSRTGRYLLLKAVTLVVVLGIVLLIGEVWRRATFRYVRDPRRRRQFLLLRRIVIASLTAMSIVFWFVSELGSLATYAGFVTAGVAVALQSPILSVVAYFFLIGRYGIRVGDRVTISGVTGDVIEIGLVRIYLQELAGPGPDLHPTGRVVVFSNSVIFQPSALYKQMPGIDYVWHSAVLTLAAESDFQVAEKTLNAAVEAFFARYRGDIERQYRSLEQSVDMHIAPPKPDHRLRFTDAGLQYTVRYPAEIPRAIEMDTELLRSLHDTVMKEPQLKFTSEGEPKLQAL